VDCIRRKIASGQGTNTITVNTDNLGGQNVTATFEVEGIDPACPRTASCTTAIRPLGPHWRKFDEYGNIRFNDEKARLDNFAIQLQNERTLQGYVIAYGSCGDEGQARGSRTKNYLVNSHGIASGRVVVIDGGCMPALRVELWMLPEGITTARGYNRPDFTLSGLPEEARSTSQWRKIVNPNVLGAPGQSANPLALVLPFLCERKYYPGSECVVIRKRNRSDGGPPRLQMLTT
jgi:hypothetical protein